MLPKLPLSYWGRHCSPLASLSQHKERQIILSGGYFGQEGRMSVPVSSKVTARRGSTLFSEAVSPNPSPYGHLRCKRRLSLLFPFVAYVGVGKILFSHKVCKISTACKQLYIPYHFIFHCGYIFHILTLVSKESENPYDSASQAL